MVKKFLEKKYTKLAIFLLLLLISGFTFYFFVRAENPDDNKFTVNNLKVVSVQDGLPDTTDPSTGDPAWIDTTSYDKASGTYAGTDNADNNGVVRTFDSVKYNIKYNLNVKDGQSADMSSQRTVIVDVLFPGNFNGKISSDITQAIDLRHSSDGNYTFGEVTFSSEPGVDITRTVTLSEIDWDNNATLTPIFIIRESTDNDTKSISSFSDEELAGIDFSTTTEFNYINSASYCTEGVQCSTTVTGVENYIIELYNGSTTRDSIESATTPLGIGVILNSVEGKGIIGLVIPRSVRWTMVLPANGDGITNSFVTNSEKNYATTDPAIFINEDNDRLPAILNGTPEVSLDTSCPTNNCFDVIVNDIDKNYTIVDNKYYINTTLIKTNLARETGVTADLTYPIKATYNGRESNTLSIQDKVGNYVGVAASRISLFDSGTTSYDDSEKKPDGAGIYNYGQSFVIKNTTTYTSGTNLKDVTNYLKIDNDAIKVIPNETTQVPIDINTTNTSMIVPNNYKVTYGFGHWTSDYFSVDSNACPSVNISDLSKEEMMNLYGGPCLVPTSNFKWADDIDSLEDQALLEYGPLVIKVEFGESPEIDIIPDTTFNEIVYARIKNDASLVKTTHQIVTNSTGSFENDSHNIELYYLSNQAATSATDMMKNSQNFEMTSYDYTNRNITSLNNAVMCNSLTCAITGNSLLIGAVRVNKPSVKAYSNDAETSEFYYYPIEWKISTSAFYYDFSDCSFNSGTVYVDIPNYLNVVNYGNGVIGDYMQNDSPEGYKRYRYTFTQEELEESGGKIDFSVYTTIGLNVEDGLQPTVIATADYSVTDASSNVSSAISPASDRSNSTTVTIHNNSSVGLLGTTTPSYIEKGGTYTYNIQAYNNSIEPSNPEGYTYNNPVAYYVLPYNRDSSYEEQSSKYDATKVKFGVTIENLPEGYKAYYTNAASATIIDNEMNNANGTISWVEWNNPTSKITSPTAIKIVKTATAGTPALAPNEYFGGEAGINIKVITTGSNTDDRFYNSFFIIADKPSSIICDSTQQQEDGGEECDMSSKRLFSSSKSLASVYSRQISGFVFEDYDYSGLYDNNDSKLSDIPVSVCKVTATEFDPENPSTYVTDTDECVADTTTDIDGSFIFRGLSEGKYYVKYIFNNDKYLVADKKVISPTEPDSNSINSKASQLPNKNIAVSSVIEFVDKDAKVNYMNLGLRIKKQFAIEINKYITNVTVEDYHGYNSYDYDKATKVTLNFTNPKDAKLRVTYGFSIENTKYFPGYVGVIVDKMPAGMTFDETLPENKDWVLFDGALYYNGIVGQLLVPGEKKYFTLALDLDVKQAGTYTNLVAARELVLMGDELPEYDFSSLNLISDEEPPADDTSGTGDDTAGTDNQNNTEGGE